MRNCRLLKLVGTSSQWCSVRSVPSEANSSSKAEVTAQRPVTKPPHSAPTHPHSTNHSSKATRRTTERRGQNMHTHTNKRRRRGEEHIPVLATNTCGGTNWPNSDATGQKGSTLSVPVPVDTGSAIQTWFDQHFEFVAEWNKIFGNHSPNNSNSSSFDRLDLNRITWCRVSSVSVSARVPIDPSTMHSADRTMAVAVIAERVAGRQHMHYDAHGG